MKAFFRGNPAPVWSRPVGTFEGCRGDPQERSIEMKAKTDPASIGIHRDGEEPGRPESESRAGPASAAWRFRPSAAVLAAFLLGPGAERVAAQDPLFLVDIARGGMRGSFEPGITPAPGVIFLRAGTAETGLELWRTDGSPEGTSLVRDIRPGPEGSSPEDLAVAGSVLVFAADDGEHGPEIWASDGTDGGTLLIEDIAPGAAGSYPTSLTAVGDTVYFIAEGAGGSSLWKTNGTPEGTALVEAVPNPSNLTSEIGRAHV